MLQRREQPAATKLLSPNGNPKNQFPQSYGKLACCGSENSQPQRSYFHQTATRKINFFSRTETSRLQEQEYTTRITDTFVKRQPEKLVSQVVQEQACYKSKNTQRVSHRPSLKTATGKTSFPSHTRTSMPQRQENTTCNAVIYTKRQPGELISQVVRETSMQKDGKHTTRITVTSTKVQPKKSVIQIVHTGIYSSTWTSKRTTGKTSRASRQGPGRKQNKGLSKSRKYLGELRPIRRRLR